MISLPSGETVVRLRSAERDKFGDRPEVDDELEITNVGVDWESTDENTAFREATTSQVVIWAPRGADILPVDRVRLSDGSVWRVVGRPMWNGIHPMNGHDFGVKKIQLKES